MSAFTLCNQVHQPRQAQALPQCDEQGWQEARDQASNDPGDRALAAAVELVDAGALDGHTELQDSHTTQTG